MVAEFERRRLRVYVAGPISSDPFEGVHRGFAAARQMFIDGLAPFIPHADALWFLPEGNWNSYLEYDLEYVSVGDAVYRLRGDSKGADLECDVALTLNIPVFREGAAWDPILGVHVPDGYEALLDFAQFQGLAGKQQVTA